MTIFGPDISSYEAGLDLARLGTASFVIAKTTEGTYYTDADYQGWRKQAAALKKPFVWYHFLSGEDPHTQVAHLLDNVGDRSLPGMLDVEPTSTFRPSLAQTLAWLDAAHDAGLRVPLVYLPRWYWQEIGSPDLRPIGARGSHLVASTYPGGSGTPAQLYPGDTAAGWQPYGGLTPALYQYTNQATDGGRSMDYNAFRGTVAGLLTLLGGTPMSYTVTAGWQTDYPDVAAAMQKHIPVGTIVDGDTAAGLGMVRSFVAAERAGTIEAQLTALSAAVAKLATPPAPVVDVAALAAALAPLLATGPTADEVALAVEAHLGAALTKGAA